MVEKYEALERLSKLKADGIVTDDEFAAEKARVLRELDADRDAKHRPPRRRIRWAVLLVLALLGGLVAIGQIERVTEKAASGQGNGSAPHDSVTSEIPQVPGPESNPERSVSQDELSACDASDTREALTNAFEHSAAERFANIQVLDITNIIERIYYDTKPERICAADVTLNVGRKHVGFRIYPTSDRANFIVETMTDPGPTVASVVNDDWLTGRWFAPERTAADCSAPEDADGYIEFRADHRFIVNHTSGSWALDGTTIVQTPDDQPPVRSKIIGAAQVKFIAESVDGTGAFTFIRCM